MPKNQESFERKIRAEEHFRKLGLLSFEDNTYNNANTTAEEEEILISDSECED
jgi:hypothetical protein